MRIFSLLIFSVVSLHAEVQFSQSIFEKMTAGKEHLLETEVSWSKDTDFQVDIIQPSCPCIEIFVDKAVFKKSAKLTLPFTYRAPHSGGDQTYLLIFRGKLEGKDHEERVQISLNGKEEITFEPRGLEWSKDGTEEAQTITITLKDDKQHIISELFVNDENYHSSYTLSEDKRTATCKVKVRNRAQLRFAMLNVMVKPENNEKARPFRYSAPMIPNAKPFAPSPQGLPSSSKLQKPKSLKKAPAEGFTIDQLKNLKAEKPHYPTLNK